MKVGLLSPYEDRVSETFIRAHRERLPHDVVSLHEGEYPPYRRPGEVSFTDQSPWNYGRVLLRRLRDGWTRARFRLTNLREDFDVVLAEYGPTGVAVREECRRLGLPLVVHFHGRDAYHYRTLERNRELYRQLFDAATSVVGVSEHMCEQLLDLGAPSSKLRLNPYGVDEGTFHGARPGDAPPRFLTVGRFVEKKAFLTTLKAFARVHSQYPDVRLTMIGDGPLREPCEEWVHDEGLEGIVEFEGVVKHRRIPEYHRRARGFLQHSVRAEDGDAEGTPVAILEAMASGLPVVSTRHTGIPEAVNDAETGFLVEERDLNGMAESIETLVEEPGLAEEMGTKGRRRVLRNYTLEESIGELSRILTEAAEGS